jgi:hypothetical protein
MKSCKYSFDERIVILYSIWMNSIQLMACSPNMAQKL